MGKKLFAGKFLWGASAAIGLIFFGAFLAFPPPALAFFQRLD